MGAGTLKRLEKKEYFCKTALSHIELRSGAWDLKHLEKEDLLAGYIPLH